MQRIKKRYIIAVAILLVASFINPSFNIKIKSAVFEIVSFPFKIINILRNSVASKSDYMKENNSLKEKSAFLALELSRYSSIFSENERLRRLLKFKRNRRYRAIASEVIGRAPQAWSKLIIINKGKLNNIKKNMAVCTAKGLVGTVVETGPYTSKVMLVTDPNSRIGVVLEKSRQTGVLIGSESDICKVIYLSMDSDINPNEKVLTSGFGGIFPKNIVIGEVTSVSRDRIKFYRYADVRLSQDLNAIEEVLCIE